VKPCALTIPGKPLTWARAKANFRRGRGKPVYYTADDRRAKMEEITYLWRVAGHGILEGPISAEIEFLFRRPNGQFNAAGQVRPQAVGLRPGRGTNGGDIDNLVKIVLDALNTVAYADDLQIAELWTRKRYAGAQETPETRVVLTELTEAPMVSDGQLTLPAFT